MKEKHLINFKSTFTLLFMVLSTIISVAQNAVSFQFTNNSPDFADNEIYIGIIGNVTDSGTVWVDLNNNTETVQAVKKLSANANTIHKTASDWGYAAMFVKLSDINNKTVYLPQISSCRFFISFKSQLYLHFHATGGYAGPTQAEGDPNYGIRYELVELSNVSNGMWINTTRVDSYQYPMGLEVTGKSGNDITYGKIGELLTHQAILQKWDDKFSTTDFEACYQKTGPWLNNPQGGIILQPSKIDQFKESGVSHNYFQDYIDRIWNYYATNELIVDMGDRGVYRGKVYNNILKMESTSGVQAWINGKPNTQEVIEAKGLLAQDVTETPDKDADLSFQALFSASVNRGAIDLTVPVGQQQVWNDNTKYFGTETHNKYVAFFHNNEISYNSKTYAFAYDDVFDQSSTIQIQNPQQVRITVGGFANLASAVLDSLSLKSTTTKAKTGAVVKFTASGYDQNRFPMTITPQWSTNGGTIDGAGNFSSTTAGDFTITATVGSLSVSSKITVEVGVAVTGCLYNTTSGDFQVEVSKDTSNPTITFVPLQYSAGETTCLLFYSTTPNNWSNVGANSVQPNEPFKITGSANDKIYFYYVYSTSSGNKNSLASNDSFTIGSCIVNSINENILIPQFDFYPNPVSDHLTISNYDENYNKVIIYNVCGTIALETSIAKNQSTINLSHLAKGIYFIALKGNTISSPLKMMKL